MVFSKKSFGMISTMLAALLLFSYSCLLSSAAEDVEVVEPERKDFDLKGIFMKVGGIYLDLIGQGLHHAGVHLDYLGQRARNVSQLSDGNATLVEDSLKNASS
uniref:Uncharacterized protein n=1 Tax=Ditylenchus dipsaci TaxID=166011 RepID=A0A915DA80_9BILA